VLAPGRDLHNYNESDPDNLSLRTPSQKTGRLYDAYSSVRCFDRQQSYLGNPSSPED
jgi:hypothetical protein